ncbi:hypothetical protein V0288_24145 [Pannus brasiliensis CCIBt3594]|uniref:Uncharacterized protein n=1 Tax=Pannus brasiliensis CCIBt3594 TaxID=1427578 RepID=A0AAW9QTJ0_9CHRO
MEFILQKEGEDLGRSLSSSTLGILSGKYRLLGRLDSPARDVEVRIDFESRGTIERKTSYHRSDAGGFIEILPYTDLAPGNWRIRCYGDILDELHGRGWRESLQLIVSSRLVDPLERLEALIGEEIEPFLSARDDREVIQLRFADLEKNSSFVFDLRVPSGKNERLEGVDLPDPATMTKILQRSIPVAGSSLPPKLSSTPSRQKAPQLPAIPRNS